MFSRVPVIAVIVALVYVAALAGTPDKSNASKDWQPFQPVIRPSVPTVNIAGWVRNELDSFVAAEHERRGLMPLAEAPRHVLLRRVYLDLIGLPPTREELAAFLADESPGAYEKVVDRLLASPCYGERWGRHWMDVWRYSDWAGYGAEVRESQPHIWRWRDWIIESLNADKGYDRMLVEMLAGDELAPTDPDTLRATGYLARNWFKFNRNTWLENTVDHTAKAFLGVTLGCARCHEHKYDPIAQEEYYRFRAFFEPHDVRTDSVAGEPDVTKDGLSRVFDGNAAAATFLFVRGNEASPDKEHPLAPGVPDLFGKPLAVQAIALPPTAYYPGLRPFVQESATRQAEADVSKAETALVAANQAVAAAKQRVVELASQQRELLAAVSGDKQPASVADPAEAMAAVHKAKTAAVAAEQSLVAAQQNLAAVRARIAADNARFASTPAVNAQQLAQSAGVAEREAAVSKWEADLSRADREFAAARRALNASDEKTKNAVAAADKKLAEARKTLDAARDAASKPASSYTPLGPIYPATSTGRRLALARWIADRENPLTARVAVNHIWLRHFGSALVPTVFDFGSQGQPPSHPELLDWLAAELMESGWSMKRLHRLIVTSSTYRMASDDPSPPAPLPASGERGASDLAAGNSAAAGDHVAAGNRAADPDNRYLWRMNTRRMEAEAVRDSVIHVAGQLDLSVGGPDLDQNAGLTSLRRSLYFRHANEKQMLFLALFDAANVNECYRRYESVAPQQALALTNSVLSLQEARILAGKLAQQVGDATSLAGRTAFVAAAFEQVLCRQPTPDELAECNRFLAEQADRLAAPAKLAAFTTGPAATVKPAADPHQRARESLVHVLMNHNDFVMIR